MYIFAHIIKCSNNYICDRREFAENREMNGSERGGRNVSVWVLKKRS